MSACGLGAIAPSARLVLCAVLAAGACAAAIAAAVQGWVVRAGDEAAGCVADAAVLARAAETALIASAAQGYPQALLVLPIDIFGDAAALAARFRKCEDVQIFAPAGAIFVGAVALLVAEALRFGGACKPKGDAAMKWFASLASMTLAVGAPLVLTLSGAVALYDTSQRTYRAASGFAAAAVLFGGGARAALPPAAASAAPRGGRIVACVRGATVHALCAAGMSLVVLAGAWLICRHAAVLHGAALAVATLSFTLTVQSGCTPVAGLPACAGPVMHTVGLWAVWTAAVAAAVPLGLPPYGPGGAALAWHLSSISVLGAILGCFGAFSARGRAAHALWQGWGLAAVATAGGGAAAVWLALGATEITGAYLIGCGGGVALRLLGGGPSRALPAAIRNCVGYAACPMVVYVLAYGLGEQLQLRGGGAYAAAVACLGVLSTAPCDAALTLAAAALRETAENGDALAPTARGAVPLVAMLMLHQFADAAVTEPLTPLLYASANPLRVSETALATSPFLLKRAVCGVLAGALLLYACIEPLPSVRRWFACRMPSWCADAATASGALAAGAAQVGLTAACLGAATAGGPLLLVPCLATVTAIGVYRSLCGAGQPDAALMLCACAVVAAPLVTKVCGHALSNSHCYSTGV
eukprot:TRINITY_DN16717_c0_g1_i1.p1 TRINITY_DN16717_c0_g1~~TRINITY_DN16717_c0_g1_i1.p1  ORF type:complete len:642 (+),score=119.39 TRINITY_DN16717_c0_g1_i1:45-1970(+)